MAGNSQADNNGNIYVEFDYNNLILVDPNKTIDKFNKVNERLVDHENLVMYANLEAELLPRTKLAVGASTDDSIRTISIAKINFLKPTKNSYLGTGYYDELTGQNTTQLRGANQMKQQAIVPPNGDTPYIRNSVADQTSVLDNGLLGITQINITTNTSFIPSVKIELEDVQGRALFQLGDNSPYAAFFNLPYPQFYLTLKGYYGQAIKYQLNLEKFNARFNSFSGNYQISLEFQGYKFNILNEVSMGHLLATPHMYGQLFNVTNNTVGVEGTNKSAQAQSKIENAVSANASNSTTTTVTQVSSEKGYQKIIEIYSEYKSKGLLDPDFPELTLLQLMNKIQNFENNIAQAFTKAEVEPLTNIRTYKSTLKQYFDAVRGSESSWFNRYLNPNPLILLNGDKVYVFKKLDLADIDKATEELKNIITTFNTSLAENKTLGTVKGTPAPIPNSIKYETIEYPAPPNSNIDWTETTKQQTGSQQPTELDKERIRNQYPSITTTLTVQVDSNNKITPVRPNFFIFEGDNRFDKIINSIQTQANKKLSEYETLISAKLLEKIQDKSVGLGFKPTVKNIIAVIMASAEAFIRLMDDVHTNAWDVKYDPVRKSAILDNSSSAPGSDTVGHVQITTSASQENQGLSTSQIPVYPWPQFFVETPEDKKARFQLKYIADPTVVNQTQGYLYDKWPEVEFVEEYIKGLTLKFNAPAAPEPLDSERNTNIINLNAIEFPSDGTAYLNKEEIKFFYEIWERQFVTSHYSGLVRANLNQINDLIKLNVEAETNNIVTSLGVSSPYLTFKLKNYDLTAQNYENTLMNISNSGTGRSYQDFIRDFYVTPYLRSLTENSFSILNVLDLGKIPQTATQSTALRSLLTNASNDPLVVDTIPYTNEEWNVTNLSNGVKSVGNSVYNTTNTLTIFEPRKIISNFTDVYNFTTNRPVTNFSYLKINNPISELSNYKLSEGGLFPFYFGRTPENFVATEGYVNYVAPTKALPERTTTSMLNTPYFVNAIQNGVESAKKDEKYPYVQAAYLFINSLPLASLREKYKTYNNNTTVDLDYISSCLKKFGAIHKLPYAWVLKFGSIWHRYKKFRETNIDILDTAWSDFNYVNNYSPIQKTANQTYTIKINDKDTNICLENETDQTVKIQVGFYPKLINDFNYFYNGFLLYSKYTNEEIQTSITTGMKLYNFVDSNITSAKQGDKDLNLSTWSVLLPNNGILPDVSACDTVIDTSQLEYFVVPSFGSGFNQTKNDCLINNNTTPTTVVNLTGNQSMYNGSVRTLWSSPNYGYFDNSQITKSPYYSYINKIDPSISEQSPFELLTNNSYSTIEEIFSVFEKKILDQFEEEFLNFSKPVTEISSNQKVAQFNTSTVNLTANLRNFQSLFTSLMTIPVKTNQSTENYFNEVINEQYSVFQNGIKTFMEYDILFRYGNPSNYKRRIFDSYLSYLSTPVVVDPINFEPYVKNSLPSSNGQTTVTQSREANTAAWIALETEVGFSTISGAPYTNSGSVITDFFIDNNIAFTQQNVILLAPIIKMYATQKINNLTITVSQFKGLISAYLQREGNLQNYFLNQLLDSVRRALPNQQQVPERRINSATQGDQSKVEIYEVFKALNDKWIAGGDFKSKTLFEDILFLDRASRNIGDTIILDIFDLQNILSQNSLNQAMSVFTFISGILIKNNFNVMNLPGYVNFYNVQDADGTTIPQSEGTLEFANNMWGTFLNVDYRKSGPKMVCFYAGKPSQYLQLPNGNFRFRDDGFELNRASENPLIEDQQGKKDWAQSNKCVGFNVDIGIRNQNIFYSFSVSQDNGVATSETINTYLNMVNQATGRNTATQNVSLYNLYKNRSYKCTVTSLGNALLQPTMYFNLRHVPMFNGPYMIQDVQHTIQPGNFQTTFTGVRQGIFDLSQIDSYIQSMNQNLLTRLEEVLKISKDDVIIPITSNNEKSSNIVQTANNTLDTSNSCVSNVDTSVYVGYENITGSLITLNPKTLKTKLQEIIPNNVDLQVLIFCITYITSYQLNNKKNGEFKGWDNNYALISLYHNYGAAGQTYFKKSYSCINVKASKPKGNSLPIVSFKDIDSYLEFMKARLEKNVDRALKLTYPKYYSCYWPNNGANGEVSESYYDTHIDEFKTVIDSMYKAIDLAKEVQLISNEKVKQLKGKINEEKSKQTGPTVTPTPSPIPPQAGQACPPPAIISFSPMTGSTGTIVQINGKNLINTTGITVNNISVDMKQTTIYNDTTIRFTIPTLYGIVTTANVPIQVKGGYGNTTALSSFVYQIK